MSTPDYKKSALYAYCVDILGGGVIACEKMKKLAEKMLTDLEKPHKQWHFDYAHAKKHVDFIEQFCKIPSGRLGAPFILEPMERAFVESIHGFVDDEGLRRYQEVFLCVARKNGKTSLGAALELDALFNDGEGSPQVYNVANSMEQATLGYNAVSKMIRLSKALSQHAEKRTTGWHCKRNFGTVKPLAANTATLDGLDVHFALIDELHAMRDRDVYDLVKQGMAARRQPILLCCTTNGFVRNGVFDAQYRYASGVLDGSIEDDRFLPWVYELDAREEWTDPKAWQKANPNLGTVKKIDYLENNVQKAKQDASFRATVLTKDFNLPENQSQAWLTFDEAVNTETFDLQDMGFKYCIIGFDASDTIDLTCAQAFMMRPDDEHIYEHSMYWIPEDALLEREDAGKRRERDDVPYRQWINRGFLRAVPGNKIDKKVLIEWIAELAQVYGIYTFAVGFDPWHMDDSTLRDLKAMVGNDRVEPVRQGAITLSQPMKQLKSDYKQNRIIDNHNPVNEWCRMNVEVKTDTNGNIQPNKKNLNPKNRIDGFAAELDAYVTLLNRADDFRAMNG